MSRRVGAAEVLLAVCTGVGAARGLVGAAVNPAPGVRHPAIVADYDTRRLAGLGDILPPGGVVGYVTNEPDSAEATRSYYLAQYVLAPCVVVRGDRQEFVIVDDRPECEVRPPTVSGRLLRDLGDGVRLYGRGGP